MKKQIIFTLATIIVAGMVVSCKKYTAQTAPLTNQNDSLNYALGYANGDGIKNYYMSSIEDKDAAIKAFIEALDKAYNSDAAPDEMHQLGVNIGSSLKQQEKDGLMGEKDLKFNFKLVKQGLENALNGQNDSTAWSASDAQNYIQTVMMQIQAEKAAKEAANADEEVVVEEEIIEEDSIETK